MEKQIFINESAKYTDDETENFFFLKSQAKTADTFFVSFEWKWVQDSEDPSTNNKVRICTISCYDQKEGYLNFEIPMIKLHQKGVLISETEYLINGKTSLEMVIYPISDS